MPAPEDRTLELKGVVGTTKAALETRMILEALVRNRWNRRMAADQLRISDKALHSKIREFDLKTRFDGWNGSTFQWTRSRGT
jgi:DNA-binding NtrC family response regulator